MDFPALSAAEFGVSTPPALNEEELLLEELKLRMRWVVQSSPRLSEAMESPRALYEILTEFFEVQQRRAQGAQQVRLSVTDVRGVWLFCLGELELHARETITRATAEEEGRTAGSPRTVLSSSMEEREAAAVMLRRYVERAPVLPMQALQREVPTAFTRSETDSVSASASAAGCQPHVSIFSLLRHIFPSLLDLAYVVQQRLGLAMPSTAIPVLPLAALAASLTPALDRVQTVRVTAQLADDLAGSRVYGSSCADDRLSHPATSVALFLAGIWYVWGVLDAKHSAPLQALGTQLLKDVFASEEPSHDWGFTAWLQRSLKAEKGQLHQQLYATAAATTARAPPARGGVTLPKPHYITPPPQTSRDVGNDDLRDEALWTGADGDAIVAPRPTAQAEQSGVDAAVGDVDFWARLAGSLPEGSTGTHTAAMQAVPEMVRDTRLIQNLPLRRRCLFLTDQGFWMACFVRGREDVLARRRLSTIDLLQTHVEKMASSVALQTAVQRMVDALGALRPREVDTSGADGGSPPAAGVYPSPEEPAGTMTATATMTFANWAEALETLLVFLEEPRGMSPVVQSPTGRSPNQSRDGTADLSAAVPCEVAMEDAVRGLLCSLVMHLYDAGLAYFAAVKTTEKAARGENRRRAGAPRPHLTWTAETTMGLSNTSEARGKDRITWSIATPIASVFYDL